MAPQITEKIRALLSNPKKLKAASQAFAGTVLVTSLVVTGLIAAVRKVGGLQGAELGAYDSLMRMRPDMGTDERFLVVGISEEDIQTLKEYPIHDGTMAALLAELRRNNPRAIGVDVARDVPQGEGREAMTEQFAEGEQIVAACVLSAADDPGLPPAPGTPPERAGFVDLPQDANGIIRRSILVSVPSPSDIPLPEEHICNDPNPDNQLVSMALFLSLLYLEPEGIVPEQTETGEIRLGAATFLPLGDSVVGYQRTNATDYQVLINYRSGEEAIRVVTLNDVLNRQVPSEWIENRVVLIGYTSEVAKDLFYTPFSGGSEGDRTMPGVVVHAQATSQIISAALGERPLMWYWAGWTELLWIAGWAVVGGTIAYFVRRTWLFLLAEGLAIGALYGVCYLLFLQSGWVPLVPPMIVLITTSVGVVLLDRANKGGYTQAIYEQVKEQVKVVLKPKIDIDEEKRAKQVAEITETGYFQDLMTRAKAIREQRAREEAEKQEE